MSGPKVVRIVTREEILAICNGLLGHLDSALARWERDVALVADVPAGEIKRFRARRDRIRALLDADRFAELQKAVPAEMTFLAADLEDRRTRAVIERARRRAASHRVKATAGSLLVSLAADGAAGSQLLIENLRALARGENADDAGTILHEAFAALSRGPALGEKLSDDQKALAAALGDGGTVAAISDWIAARPDPASSRDDRIADQISRLETAFGEEAAAEFQRRWDAILEVTDASRRRMMSDTLILDIAHTESGLRAQEKRRAELESLAADLDAITAHDTRVERGAIRVALSSGEDKAMDAALERGRRALNEARTVLAARAQRVALMTQLARLGYEVREGMETALVENGRIIVRTPHASDYGIEVTTAKSRYQMRAVKLGEGNLDRARDTELETIWCSDFSQIRQAIAAEGGEIQIEAAKAPGEVEVKTISGSEIDTIQAESERTRSLS
ncbi:MAG: hypothetical protein AAFU49_08080 [Pseudomonadota bacterium]